MAKYYCGEKQKMMTDDEVRLHHCLHKQKGHQKGRACKFLVDMS